MGVMLSHIMKVLETKNVFERNYKRVKHTDSWNIIVSSWFFS